MAVLVDGAVVDGWTYCAGLSDPLMGRTVWMLQDGDKTHYRTDQDVRHTLDENEKHYNASTGKRWGDGQRVASIPLNLYFAQIREAVEQDDQKYISSWLNNRDHQKFRTFKGRV